MKQPAYGSKAALRQRILETTDIDDALEIARVHRSFLAAATEVTEGDKEEPDMETKDRSTGVSIEEEEEEITNKTRVLEERKRKRVGEDETKSVEEDEEMQLQEDDEKEEGEVGDKISEVKKKPYVSRQHRMVEEDTEVDIEKVIVPIDETTEAPPMIVFGKTSDKDTDFTASARGGNDLGSNADEAGWKQVGDTESIVTAKRDNIVRTRIGLTLTLPPDKEPDKKLSLETQKWFDKMKEIDGQFTLLPWKKADEGQPSIRVSNRLPHLMSKMRMYLSRANVKSVGGKVYADVYVSHSVPMEDLKGDSEWFLRENQMGMFHKDLQVESVERKGWFLYSTPALDSKLLAEKIEEEIGVPVSLRWKYVNTEKYEKLDRDEAKKWMALHIEVSTPDGKKASRGLTRLYGSKSIAFPLGIRMRLISEFREVKGNTIMMGKHMRLRVRQASFLSMTIGHPSDEIMLLDYKPNRGGETLRSLIMSIQSHNPETPGNLFHAVGKDWKGRIILNYLKIKQEEAAMIADGLIPYLEFKYGDQVREFFDPDAVLEKEDWIWDDVRKTIVNPLSKELDGLEALDNDYDFSIAPDTENDNKVKGSVHNNVPKTAAELAAARLNLVVTGEDEDSVSTLGNPLSPAHFRARNVSSLLPIIGLSSETSVQSSTTLDTRISVIEQSMQSMAVDMQQRFDDSMDKFLSRMQEIQSNQPEKQPPGGALAGGSDG